MHGTHPLTELLAALQGATRAHPYERKLLLCLWPAEGRELLRALARTGCAWVGWEPWTLRQLAHELLGAELAGEGLGTADTFDVLALVDEAIDAVEATGETGPFPGPVPGAFRDAIRRSVETLRRAGLGASAVRSAAGRDSKLRLLAAVLAAFEAGLGARRLVDGPALLARAADRIEGGGPLPDGHLFLLPGLALRGVEGRLVRALEKRGATPLPSDPVLGLAPPSGRLWTAPGEARGPLSALHAVGTWDGPAPELDLFAAATPGDELREVLRRVLGAGIPWDQVEIVATDPDSYGAALDGQARRLGIPVTYAMGLKLSRTRVGRAAAAYFRWIAEGFPVDPIRRLLETGDLVPDTTGHPDAPAGPSLARRLRRLRIGWGHERYLPALDRALAAAERDPDPREGDGDEDAARLARERERAELEALRRLLGPILAATPRPAARHALDASTASPAGLAEGLLALLERVPAGDEVERTGRLVLVERLERARATLTRETGWRAATSMLRARLDTRISPAADAGRLTPWTSTGGHLHLSGPDTGGLAGRPHTFVVGLAAGAMGGAGADPLLTDRDRTLLNRQAPPAGSSPAGSSPLESTAERLAANRHALAAMLARLRGRVTLSHSAWDMTEGRAIGPAPELLQALRLRQRDPFLTYTDLRAELGRLACAVPGPELPAEALADGADVWLAALATADGRLRDGRAAVRAAQPGLDRGLVAEEARGGRGISAYHGAIGPRTGLDPRTDGTVVSPSRLETLGRCPLRYFYRYVLGIHPVRDPRFDPEAWLDPLERGSLLHGVYERATRERPEGVGFDDDRFDDLARAILDQEIERTLYRLPAPNEAVLRSEREALLADLRSFVAMLRAARPDVVATELAFGPDPGSEGEVELDVPGGRLRVRGRVDRLDRLAGGGLRVVDYKTGRAIGYPRATPFDGGRRLQHLLYSLAVEQLRPGASVEVMEYHFPTARGENRVVRYPRAELGAGLDVVAALLDLVRDGMFLATTVPDDCRFCDFGAVCHVRIDNWGNTQSPRAAWARATGAELDEYRPLVQLRMAHGGG